MSPHDPSSPPSAEQSSDEEKPLGALGKLVEAIYREIPRYLGYSRASLLLYDEKTKTLISDEQIGVNRPGETGLSAPQPASLSISGKCFSEQRPIVINDCSKSDLVPSEYIEQFSLKSVAAVPVTVKGKVIGVLRIDDAEKINRFTPEDVEFLSMLAEMLGTVAINPHLRRELRGAEEAVRESERNFRALAENANDGILIATGDGEIVYANVPAAEITGLPPGTLSGRQMRDLIPGGRGDEVMALCQRILGGEIQSRRQHETLFVRPDGKVVPLELSIAQTEWKGETALLAILRDITIRRRLERQVLMISEDEQRRFGRDLHDGVGQTLAAIAVKCKVIERRMGQSPEEMSEDIAHLARLAKHAVEEAHGVARGLSPVHLEQRGLAVALRELADELETAFGIPCRFQGNEVIAFEDGTVTTQFYRIAQEAATNALKHSKPSRVEITLTRSDNALALTVRDDGIGFAKDDTGQWGMGMQTMKYRANMIGAKLDIETHQGQGATVRCSLLNPETPQ